MQVKYPFLIILFCLVLHTVFALAQNTDKLEDVTVTGIFDGKKVVVGNFQPEEVYKINEYCIAVSDISVKQADSLKGKKIVVSGKLKISEGKYGPTKTSNDGRIYEPYKEPDKKFIMNPKFTIIWETREPLNTK